MFTYIVIYCKYKLIHIERKWGNVERERFVIEVVPLRDVIPSKRDGPPGSPLSLLSIYNCIIERGGYFFVFLVYLQLHCDT